jgi:dienelactone hydrolase
MAAGGGAVRAAEPEALTDRRLTEIRHLDLRYSPRWPTDRAAWERRAPALRDQILAAAGLLPMPARPPIQAERFGKVDRGAYTVEKVLFESLPGFYVTGNLYLPKGPLTARSLPVVLCPHGHWNYGRLENSTLNSGPSRAANFAMQGYIAFIYDMVGYNDSAAISHRFAPGHREGADRESLWSINLLGLQLWNSLRAVDFLLTLPEADPARVGVTGESGGGTQTFLLAAIDERIRVSGPVNMISYVMQGGSLCENAPNLRIDTDNVEIGSLAAPRPMIMVSATGDWTRNTWTEEYPATRAAYRLLDAEEKLTTIQIDAPHNYNQASREAVYGWFSRWLRGIGEGTSPIPERGGGILPTPELLVFYGRTRPAGEKSEAELTAWLMEHHRTQLREAFPTDAAGLARYQATFGQTFRQSILAMQPAGSDVEAHPRASVPAAFQPRSLSGTTTTAIQLTRRGHGDLVQVYQTVPGARAGRNSRLTLVIDPLPDPSQIDAEAASIRDNLVRAGHTVLLVKTFPGGRVVPAEIKFFSTYNRTDQALRVQDILTSIAFARTKMTPNATLSLVAPGEAGLWALLARGLATGLDRTAVDTAAFPTNADEAFVTRLPIPGIRRAGDFVTAVSLAPLTPLLLHGTGNQFETTQLQALYARFGQPGHLTTNTQKLALPALVQWLEAAP